MNRPIFLTAPALAFAFALFALTATSQDLLPPLDGEAAEEPTQDLLPQLPPALVTARITVDPAQIEESLNLPPGGQQNLNLANAFRNVVDFPEGASLTYVPRLSQLVHINTRANQDKLGHLLVPGVPPAQVEVEVALYRDTPGESDSVRQRVKTLRVMTLSGETARAEESTQGGYANRTLLEVTPVVAADRSITCDIQWTGRSPNLSTTKSTKTGKMAKTAAELVLSNRVTCVDGKPVVVHERLLPGRVRETLVVQVALVDDRGVPVRDIPPSIEIDEPEDEDAAALNLATWRVDVPAACEGAAIVERLRGRLDLGSEDLRWDAGKQQIVHRNDLRGQRQLITLLRRMCSAPASPKLKLEVVRVPVEGAIDPLDPNEEARKVVQYFILPGASGKTAHQISTQIGFEGNTEHAMEISLLPLVASDSSKAHVTVDLSGTIKAQEQLVSDLKVHASVVVRDGIPAVVHKRQTGSEFECLVLTCDLVDRQDRPVRAFPFGFAVDDGFEPLADEEEEQTPSATKK